MRTAAIVVLGLVVMASCAHGTPTKRAGDLGVARAGTPTCRPDPLGGVHNPDRLEMIRPCKQLTGTVTEVHGSNDEDGDITFNLRVDPPDEKAMNARNLAEGGLHVEIVPADRKGCTPGAAVTFHAVTGLGTCTGANLVAPKVGDHVRLIGALVRDVSNGWNELHPVWFMEPAVPRT